MAARVQALMLTWRWVRNRARVSWMSGGIRTSRDLYFIWYLGISRGLQQGSGVDGGRCRSVRIGRSQPTLWGHAMRDPRQGLARG